jgi:Holliday junction resolvase RusA-like endonuclease
MLTVVALGEPATQGSFKALVSKGTGQAIVVKDNKKAQNAWRANVRDETRKVMDGRDPMEGPVVLTITFTWPKPVSAPKRKPSWPCKRPDWDKLARAVSDGLRDGGAYKDDAQVVWAVVIKDYPVTSPDRQPLYAGDDVAHMLLLFSSTLDVLNVPGVVVRLAHLTEFPGIRKQLADAGFEPKDIPGGS